MSVIVERPLILLLINATTFFPVVIFCYFPLKANFGREKLKVATITILTKLERKVWSDLKQPSIARIK